MCRYVHMSATTQGIKEMVLDPLGPELQAVLCFKTSGLRTKLRPMSLVPDILI